MHGYVRSRQFHVNARRSRPRQRGSVLVPSAAAWRQATQHPRHGGAARWCTNIYPRSLADATGDGVGDLEGIRAHLDHLAWLGVDALWLSPVFRSPMADFGYDVSDHCDIDPLFGTLADFDRLLADAHARGIRLLLDFVPNHTSDRHPWFVEARRARTGPRRGWYVWREPAPGGGPPNDWVAAFGRRPPAWTFDPTTGQYYLHLFLPEQPDLDWSNPAVETAMHDVLRFWLELHLVFELPAAVLTPWDAAAWRERIAHTLDTLEPIAAWPAWVLSNHDTPRHRTRFGSEARARAAAVLLLTLPGTPFLYAGEELGLEDAVVTPDRALDPGRRDGCRAPIPWTPAAERRNVGSLRADPTSILHLYRRLLAARRASPALRLGACRLLPAPDGVLASTRILGRDRRTVLVNFAAGERAYPLTGTVAVASDGRNEGRPYRGVLKADAAVIVSGA